MSQGRKSSLTPSQAVPIPTLSSPQSVAPERNLTVRDVTSRRRHAFGSSLMIAPCFASGSRCSWSAGSGRSRSARRATPARASASPWEKRIRYPCIQRRPQSPRRSPRGWRRSAIPRRSRRNCGARSITQPLSRCPNPVRTTGSHSIPRSRSRSKTTCARTETSRTRSAT